MTLTPLQMQVLTDACVIRISQLKEDFTAVTDSYPVLDEEHKLVLKTNVSYRLITSGQEDLVPPEYNVIEEEMSVNS